MSGIVSGRNRCPREIFIEVGDYHKKFRKHRRGAVRKGPKREIWGVGVKRIDKVLVGAFKPRISKYGGGGWTTVALLGGGIGQR